MRIGFLIKIIHCCYTEKISYEKIDTFIELNNENESLEIKIMKKYPTLNNIYNCNDYIVFDQFTKEKYLIVSDMI
jgi:uncharacterized pyridoxamine 5'-phosphate oxidase family protein